MSLSFVAGSVGSCLIGSCLPYRYVGPRTKLYWLASTYLTGTSKNTQRSPSLFLAGRSTGKRTQKAASKTKFISNMHRVSYVSYCRTLYSSLHALSVGSRHVAYF
eukprot:scaffold67498_cov49-Attheya_sp.AAC.2